MTYIDLLHSTITISDIEQLKQYQIAQLKYYGFALKNEYLFFDSETPVDKINELINYFEGEQIAYTLSKILTENIRKFKERRKDLNHTFALGRAIKMEGKLGHSFTEFRRFTYKLPRTLKPHQLKSAFHFYSLRNGANFSVPGSGKTSTVLAVYEKFREEGLCNLLFIVGPPSCFQPWQNEFLETLGRKPDTKTLSGGRPELRKLEYVRPRESSSELYLCTFHTAANDVRDIVKFLSQTGINAFVIIDEAHYMKQQGGSWASSLLEIGRQAICKGVLTGTPIPQSYKDLFNLFDFLWTDDNFLTEKDKINITLWEKRKNVRSIRQLLEEKISPLFYRVRKKDLGLKEAIFHTPLIVKMNENERSIYDSIHSKIKKLSEHDPSVNEDALNGLWRGRMIRLRQSVSYSGLLSSAIEKEGDIVVNERSLQHKITHYDEMELPAKLVALTKLVQEIRQKDRKILIWSNFVGTLEMIRRHFLSIGLRAELIYGKTPVRKDDQTLIGEEKTREGIRDAFLNYESDLDILIANPAACAESISLHKTCFHAIYYDLSYNCSQYLQSLDRIHRVGGSEHHEANYYFLQYEDSIDQDIRQNLEQKARRMSEIIDQDYRIYELNLNENEDDDILAYQRLFKH